jgi:hypothetical protein
MPWSVSSALMWTLAMFGTALILSLAIAEDAGWLDGGRR